MRNPIAVLLDPWHSRILGVVEAVGLSLPLERLVRWVAGHLTRPAA